MFVLFTEFYFNFLQFFLQLFTFLKIFIQK